MAKKRVKKIAIKPPVYTGSLGRRTRSLVRRSARLWSTNENVMAEAQATFFRMKKNKEISLREIWRILEAPLSTTRMIAKLRSFNAGKLSLAKLMDGVNRAFRNQVPETRVKQALKCRNGKFFELVHKIMQEFEPPMSFATNLTIKKIMKEIEKGKGRNQTGKSKVLEELRKKANTLRNKIHTTSSARYKTIGRIQEAEREGKKPKKSDLQFAEAYRKSIDELQMQFISEVMKEL